VQLGERHHRARRLQAAPHPLAPHDPHPAVAEGCVVQQMLSSAVRHRENTTAVTALDLPVRLDRQSQPAQLALGREDTHSWHTEHHRRRQAAVTTVQG
jgi:hypothetical protein